MDELTEEKYQIHLKRLVELVESHPDDPAHHFNLGRLLWERGEEWREKAAEHFLMAAKLNPQNGEAFKYLGHYYSCVCMDTQRALKCYQRAVSLNPDDAHSGEALCNLLDKEGKESLEVSVCREASGKSPRAFWAFSRLGFLLVHQKNWSEAVQSLQYAIRGYPSSADLWEGLGLAYQRLGMYTAAIKSYGRAMELETSRTFAMIESGNIFLMLGSYRKVKREPAPYSLQPMQVKGVGRLICTILCCGWLELVIPSPSNRASASGDTGNSIIGSPTAFFFCGSSSF